MEVFVLSVILAFLGHSLHNIGQAGQKIALSTIRRHPIGGKLFWLGCSVGTTTSFLILLAAISLGSVATVGAMAGTGLVSLAIFSHFVMHERLTWKHVFSIGGIIAGAALIGFFLGPEQFVPLLLWILAGGVVVYIAAWIGTRGRSVQGMVIGSFAGFLGAYSQLFEKLGTSELDLRAGIGTFASGVLRNPITLVWIALSLISTVILQFAYGHGKAIRIIPSYMATYIVVPVVGGVLIFGEALIMPQWFGVALIVAGTVFLSLQEPKESRRAASKRELVGAQRSAS
jgi:drug/metabolite transporter (DMT)-like permease